MKSRGSYIALICGIFVLIAAAAFLTHTLFNTPEIEKTDRNPSKKTVKIKPSSPTVTEVRIEATEPAAPPATSTKPLPPALEEQKSSFSAATADPVKKIVDIGAVVHVTGQVTAIEPSKKRRSLKENSPVFLHDRIHTGPVAKLKIKFTDNSVLSQGENSTTMLDEYVYDAGSETGNFGMRFTKGVCRLVTGLVAESNPDKVKVRTRMATIGIRGCDLGFTSTANQDKIYVFELSGKKQVMVNTSTDGRTLMNPLSGKTIPMDQAKKKSYLIAEPGNMVVVTRGQGSKSQRISLEDIRDIMGQTSRLPPARYNINQQKPGRAVITLQPDKTPASEKSEKAK